MSISKRSQVWAKTNGKCWYCGTVLDPFFFTIDHMTPKQKGGINDLSNLVPCCRLCNSQKRNRTVEGFRAILMKPQFTKIQISFLESCGVNFADLKPKPKKFYFETIDESK